MSEPHLLIVDDARDIREPLATYLRSQGYRVSLAADAGQGRAAVLDGAIDLVVLDVMMPGENGLSLCRWLVARGGPPAILLTAMADEADKIVGLELGADDYVVKPFNPRELLARIRAVLRRVPAAPPSETPSRRRFGDFLHDRDSRTLTQQDGTVQTLTSAESKLLAVLLDRPGQVLTRDQLLDLTAGREAKPYDRAIDNQVSRLRRKLGEDPKRPMLILTEWGGGYRLAADVEDEGSA
ncbi:MAG: response regulator transcription factor [Pseudomonadota bacterium]